MPKKRLGAEQIVTKLQQIKILRSQGKSIALACKEVGLTEQSFYRYRKEYGGLNVGQARKLKQLEVENGRRKKLCGFVFRKAGLEGHRQGKLVSPERRRQVVDAVREKYVLSERTACRIVGQPRGTQRFVPTLKPDEDELTQTLSTSPLSTVATVTAG